MASSESAGRVSTGYLPQLDGLRAFAVLAVLYSHWMPQRFQLGTPWGAAGVQLFFVLSGFLITGILLDSRAGAELLAHRRLALRSFYARRFLRIFPIYYAVIAATYALGLESMRQSWAWHASYLSNVHFFLTQQWAGETSHFWSLAVEEQFYLVWPTVVLFLPARHLKRLFLAVIVASAAFRHAPSLLHLSVELYSVLPFANLDALGLGALLALVTRERRHLDTLRRLGLWAMPVFVAVEALRWFGARHPVLSLLRHESMLLAFTWWVSAAADGLGGAAGRVLQLPALRYIGKISYGLYIYHNFADALALRLAGVFGLAWPPGEWVSVAVKTALIFTLASVSWHYFERPINRLKRHFPYRRPGSQARPAIATSPSSPSPSPP